jgi:hypothetical protein
MNFCLYRKVSKVQWFKLLLKRALKHQVADVGIAWYETTDTYLGKIGWIDFSHQAVYY